MKKATITFLFITTLLSSLFSLDTSIGLSGNYQGSFQYYNYREPSSNADTVVVIDHLSGDLFVDVDYFLVSVGYSQTTAIKYFLNDTSDSTTIESDDTYTYLTFKGLGKVPIHVSDRLTVFPLFGLKYFHNLSYEDEDGIDLKESMSSEEKNNTNELWLCGGLGTDIHFNKSLYLRVMGLVGYKYVSEYEEGVMESDLAGAATSSTITGLDVEYSMGLGYNF